MKQPLRTRPAYVAHAALMVVLGLVLSCVPEGEGPRRSETGPGEDSLSSGGVTAERGPGASSGVPGALSAACSVSESGRSALSLSSGTEAYVEPHGFTAFEGGFLLAGHPVLEWTVPASGPATLSAQGRSIGVLSAGGDMRRIPRPPGVGSVEWLRMVPLGPSLWGFLLDEVPVDGMPGRILYVEFDGRGWSVPEALTIPEGGTVELSMGSALRVDASGDVVWAGRFQWAGPAADVLMFRRDETGWTVSAVVRDWVDEVDLHPAADGGVWLAVTGLDPEYEAQLRSIRVVPPGTGRATFTLNVGLPGDYLQDPVLAPSPRGLSLAWRHVGASGVAAETWLQRDLDDVVDGDGIHQSPVLLDPGAALLKTLPAADGSTLWVTYHISPVTASETLRITRDDGDTLEVVFEVPYPFTGLFGVAVDPSGDILVSGPVVEMDPLSPSVRSLVLRLSLSCT